MTCILLRDWTTNESTYRLDRQTGSFFLLESKEKGKYVGYGSVISGDSAAIYHKDRRVMIWLGSREWDVESPEFRFKYFRIGTLEFVSAHGPHDATYRKLIHNVRFGELLLDPSYDQIDRDSLFFLSWINDRVRDAAWLNMFKESCGAPHKD